MLRTEANADAKVTLSRTALITMIMKLIFIIIIFFSTLFALCFNNTDAENSESGSTSTTWILNLFLVSLFSALFQALTGTTLLHLAVNVLAPSRFWWILTVIASSCAAFHTVLMQSELGEIQGYVSSFFHFSESASEIISVIVLIVSTLLFLLELISAFIGWRLKIAFNAEVEEATPSQKDISDRMVPDQYM